MPITPTYPGVYIEEIPSGVRTITGVGTSITAFVGRAQRGPVNEPVVINGFGDYERIFGGLWLESSMSFAVRDFFMNGGTQAVIVRIFAPFFATDADYTAALDAANDVVDAATTAEAAPGATAATVATAARDAVTNLADPTPTRTAAADAVADAAEAAAAITNPPATPASVRAAAQNAVGQAAPLNRTRVAVGGLNLEAATPGLHGNSLRARVDYDVAGGATDLFNLSVKDTRTGQVEVHRNLSVATASARRVDKVLAQASQLVRTRGALPATRPAASNPAGPPAGVVPVGSDPFDTTFSTGVLAADQASDGRALVATDFTTGESNKQGIYALENADLFNLLCIPAYDPNGNTEASVYTAAAAYCERRRAMLIVDPQSGWLTPAQAITGVTSVGTNSKNSAVFFPRLKQPNPLRDNQVEEFVPCGAVAGVMARTDATRGVWKAPAGLDATLVGVPELSVKLTDAENGQLNPLGINCLRTLPAAGRVVWGARTLQGDDRLASEWKYIPVRRTALFIEESLYRGTQWVVFEPNDEPLWAQIRLNIGAFMQNLFRQGAFQGRTPKEAYFVKCDKETTTQNDINLGIVNIVVGFAPLKPAEFVIIKLQQMAGQIEV